MGGPQGNSFLGWNLLASTDVAGWRVVGTGDFNGDSKPEVWQNDVTWEVVVWYMGGTQGNSFLRWELAGVHRCRRLERSLGSERLTARQAHPGRRRA